MSTENAKLRLELEATLTRFEQEMRRAVKSGTVTATTLEQRFDTMNSKLARSSQKSAAAMSGFLNVSKQGRFVLQNTAANIGDIAVQMEMGTNPMRVMGQQLPQLFGGFSALGGALGVVMPLLSAVAAVGLPLAAAMLVYGDETDETAEKVKTFTQKLDDAEAALKRAEAALKMASAGGLEDLRAKYGEVTREIRDLADELAALERRAAQTSLRSVLDSDTLRNISGEITKAIGGEAGQLAGIRIEVDKESLAAAEAALVEAETNLINASALGQPLTDFANAYNRAVEELAFLKGEMADAGALADALGPSAEAINRIAAMRDAYAAALDAGNFRAAADALAGMRESAAELGVELDAEVRANMANAESVAREFAARLDDSKDAAGNVAGAASGIAPEIDNAAASAEVLTGNLRAAMAALAAVTAGINTANRRAAAQTRIKLSTIGDPTARAAGLAREDFNEQSGAAAYAMIRSGNASRLEELAATADRVAQGAADVTAAEESLRSAEKAYAESLRQGRRSGGGGRSGGGRGSARTEKPLFENVEAEIVQLQRRIEMIGMTGDQVAKLTAKYRLLDEAKRRGLDLDARLSGSSNTLRDEIEKQADTVARLHAEYERGQMVHEQLERGIDGVADALAGALVEGENLRDGLRSVFKGIARDLIASGIKQALTSAFTPGRSAGGGGGGFLGALFGGLFGGFRESGGPVTAGKAYVVGEERPELFVPNTSGRILPDTGGTAGGHVHIVVEAVPGAEFVPQVQAIAQGVSVSVQSEGQRHMMQNQRRS